MNVIDMVEVALGLKTEDFDKGLAEAHESISDFSKKVDDAVSKSGLDKLFGKNGNNSFFFNDKKAARDFSWTLAEAADSVGHIGAPLAKAVDNTAKFIDLLSAAKKEAGSAFVFVRGLFASTLFSAGIAWVGKFVTSFKDMKQEVMALNELGKQVNGDIEDISAWSNAIEANGGSAKAFQSVLVSLQRDMTNLSVTGKSKNKPILEMLGIDTSNLSGKPIFELIGEITNSVEGMDKSQSKDILKKLGFDNDTIELIQSGSKNISELIAKQKEWAVYTKKDTEAIDRLDKSFKQINLALKSTFIPLFSRIIGIMARVMGYATKAAIWLRNNLDIVRKAVILLAVAFSGRLLKAIQTLGAMMVKNPFVLFIASLTVLLLLLEDLWTYAQGGESAFAGWWEKLGTPEEVMSGFKKVIDFFSKIGEFVDSATGKFVLLFAFLTKGILALIAMFGGIPIAIGVALAAIIAFVYAYWDELKAAFKALGLMIYDVFRKGGVLDKGFNELLKSADETWEEIKLAFKDGIDSAVSYVKEKLKSLFEIDVKVPNFKEWFDFPDINLPTFDFKNPFADITLPDFSNISLPKLDDIVPKFSLPDISLPDIGNIFNGIEIPNFDDVAEKIKNTFGNTTEWIDDKFNSLWNSVVSTANTGIGNISTFLADMENDFNTATETLKSVFMNAFNDITSWFDELVADFGSGSSLIGSFLSNAANVAKSAWEGFISWLEQKWQWLKDLLPNFKNIADKLPSIGNSAQMAMAGAGGTTTNSVVNDNSTHNATFNTYTPEATREAMRQSGFVSQANTGVAQ